MHVFNSAIQKNEDQDNTQDPQGGNFFVDLLLCFPHNTFAFPCNIVH